MVEKQVTLKDMADEYVKTDQQISSLVDQVKTNLSLIMDLEVKKGNLFMSLAKKVDELSTPKNRAERRREAKKIKK